MINIPKWHGGQDDGIVQFISDTLAAGGGRHSQLGQLSSSSSEPYLHGPNKQFNTGHS